MSRLRVLNFSISPEGFGAGPNQELQNPMGVGGMGLHGWALGTQVFQKQLFGKDGGTTGLDNDFALRGFENIGAWILGRNMFSPHRGPWKDDSWKGWWGDNPPYHCPVFIVTHHARPRLEMEGGTTFHFVTEGLQTALDLAREAAGKKDVRLGGGVSLVRQALEARLVDDLHLAVSPVLLGSGENLFRDLDLLKLGYRCVDHKTSDKALHLMIEKRI